MNRKLLGVLGAAGLFLAFGSYVGVQLSRHAQTCDSTLRHCPVPQAEVQALEGAWCNAESAGRTGPIRKTLSREGERLRLTLASPGSGQPPVVSDARFFLENGITIYFAYEPGTGAQREGKVAVARFGPDRIATRVGTSQVLWLRCDRLRENGVPPSVQALFAGA